MSSPKRHTYIGHQEVQLSSGDVIENELFFGGERACFRHEQQAGPLENVVVKNVDLVHHRKWGMRLYRVRGPIRFENVRFSSVLNEHAGYMNLAGSGDSRELAVIFRDCHWSDIGSQALQTVGAITRTDETPEPVLDARPGGRIWLLDCTLRNIGMNPTGNARRAYALSFFQSANDVGIVGVHMDCSMQMYSGGALLCQERRNLWVSGSSFRMGRCDRPIAQIVGVENVYLRNCLFEAQPGLLENGQHARLKMDIDGVENLWVENCQGDVHVHRDGVDLGPISDLELRP